MLVLVLVRDIAAISEAGGGGGGGGGSGRGGEEGNMDVVMVGGSWSDVGMGDSRYIISTLVVQYSR